MLDSIPARPATVLVVDDDADIRDLIIGQLHQENYRLLAAASLADLRRTLKEEAVDLIVLDLNLPDGDGLMLCRELRAEGTEVQIIMVTARGSAIDRPLVSRGNAGRFAPDRRVGGEGSGLRIEGREVTRQ